MNLVLFENKIKLRTLAMIIVAVCLLIYFIGAFVGFKMEYMEYKEIGENFVSIFWTNLKIKAEVMVVAFIFVYLVVYVTNLFIRKGLKNICQKENVMYQKMPNKSISFLFALFSSFGFAQANSSKILSFLNTAWFNNSDPIFHKNISYYIFQRPLYITLQQSLATLMFALIIYVIAYYVVSFSVLLDKGIRKETFKSSAFVTHVFINVALFLLVLAWGFSLNVEGIIFSNFLGETVNGKTTALVGAGFIDAYISRYVYTFLPYVIFAIILVASIFLRKKQIKKTIITVAILPAILILHGIITWGIDVFYISPNELETQRQFINYNMEYTKQGYNINTENEGYEVKNDLTLDTLNENKELIDNVRILDYQSTLKVLNQYQTIKGYYSFNDVDIASYDINGEKKAVFIAARELNEDNLQGKNYITRRFQYTHGYGLVLTSINKVDENGYPKYIIKDMTADLSQNGINVVEPRIYYGELTNDHVVVNGNNIKEFDYPNGDTTVAEYEYTADAGIKLTFGNRLLMAIKYADPKLIYSQYISKDSKLLINRNIVDRAKKIAPFLEYDNDPYLVITEDGQLNWILDAYTTTNAYPYSQIIKIQKERNYIKEVNYIRNSVKVIINAYNGETKFYIVDRDDPIVMSYYKMYPELFENLEEQIDDSIWEHIRYPEYLYNMQSDILLKYHVNNADIFYRNEDVWEIATHNNGTKEEKMTPYYGLTMLNNELQFALMQQYTPINRNNLIAWSAVSSDKEDYGKIKLYVFNNETNVLGPMQLDNQINQNADISKDLSLWSTGGSSIIRSMVVVPVNNTLLYVEPVYLAAMNESQIPAVKKIIVSNGNNLAIADNFEEAVNKLLNKEAIVITVDNSDTIEDILTSIIQTNKNMKDAANNSNWEMYGTYLQKLDDLIEKLENLQNEKNGNN